LIEVGLTHVVARKLGGKETYAKLAFGFAAFFAPLEVISGVLEALNSEFLVWVSIVMYCVYVPLCGVIATKAVYQFGWGKAIVSFAMSLWWFFAWLLCGFYIVYT
jgi:hypothetical protein